MKTRLVVRDGKVVEIKLDELQETKSNILIKEGSKLNWGDKNYQETRISTNEKGQRRNLIEDTQYKFDIRRVIDTLLAHGFAIYAEVSKQVAPFSVYGPEGNEELSFTIFNEPVDKTEDYYYAFEGTGICDVLLISISEDVGTFLPMEHDMDPAKLIDHEDPYLIENLQRDQLNKEQQRTP